MVMPAIVLNAPIVEYQTSMQIKSLPLDCTPIELISEFCIFVIEPILKYRGRINGASMQSQRSFHIYSLK